MQAYRITFRILCRMSECLILLKNIMKQWSFDTIRVQNTLKAAQWKRYLLNAIQLAAIEHLHNQDLIFEFNLQCPCLTILIECALTSHGCVFGMSSRTLPESDTILGKETEDMVMISGNSIVEVSYSSNRRPQSALITEYCHTKCRAFGISNSLRSIDVISVGINKYLEKVNPHTTTSLWRQWSLEWSVSNQCHSRALIRLRNQFLPSFEDLCSLLRKQLLWPDFPFIYPITQEAKCTHWQDVSSRIFFFWVSAQRNAVQPAHELEYRFLFWIPSWPILTPSPTKEKPRILERRLMCAEVLETMKCWRSHYCPGPSHSAEHFLNFPSLARIINSWGTMAHNKPLNKSIRMEVLTHIWAENFTA